MKYSIQSQIRLVLIDQEQDWITPSLIEAWKLMGYDLVGAFSDWEQALPELERLVPEYMLIAWDPEVECFKLSALRRMLPKVRIHLLAKSFSYRPFCEAVLRGISGCTIREDGFPLQITADLSLVKRQMRSGNEESEIRQRLALEQFLCAPADVDKQANLHKALEELPATRFGLILLSPAETIEAIGGVLCNVDPAKMHGPHLRLRELVGSQAVRTSIMDLTGCHLIVIPCQNTRALVLVGMPSGLASRRSFGMLIRKVAEMLHESCAFQSGREITALYANDLLETMEQISRQYADLIRTFPYTLFAGAGKVTALWELLPMIEERTPPLEQWMVARAAMQKAGTEEMDAIVKGWTNCLNEKYSISGLQQLVALMEESLLRCKELLLETEKFVKDRRERLVSCTSVEQLYAVFKTILMEAGPKSEKRYSNRIRLVLQFIHENFDQEITIQEIADEVGLNSEYLNKLFKKEVGQGFSKYLTAYRMEAAKKLLRTGAYRINEVSEMVGYKNSAYFSLVFHQYEGLTPSKLL